MEKTTAHQFKQLIEASKRVLITTGKQTTGDGLASALALFLILKKLNKNAEIVVDGFEAPAAYRFLPELNQIKPAVKRLKKYLISLDISQTGIEDLAYDIQNDQLRIHLTPQRGVFNPNDLQFQTSEFSFDLIITVAANDLESLGNLYDYHRDLFFQIPVINIDSSVNNDNFGHLNLIDITATSAAEIIYKLLKELEIEVLDTNIANCLLTGMIAATRSFKSATVTPQSLAIAGELINLGADRQQIVNHLYQTKTIPILKLWGKILSRLTSLPDKKLIWSKLDLHDFTETSCSPKDIHGVIDELIATSPVAEVVVLFYQMEINSTKVIVHAEGLKNALNLTRKYFPTGDKNNAYLEINKSLDLAENEIIEHLKKQL